MNTHIVIAVAVVAAAWYACETAASSEEWSVDGKAIIYQIVADGKGGCAFTRAETNGPIEILWLDKKGGVIFQSALTALVARTILSCTQSQLVFADSRGVPVIFAVDKKGVSTLIETPNGYTTGPMMMVGTENFLCDKKGFFQRRVDLYSSGRNTLVRFRY